MNPEDFVSYKIDSLTCFIYSEYLAQKRIPRSEAGAGSGNALLILPWGLLLPKEGISFNHKFCCFIKKKRYQGLNDGANHSEEARDTQLVQLLAIDVTAAVALLRRALLGDELTEKEKQALRRTLTDLASVVPIGVLKILSAYTFHVWPERLDLLRQLEKVKEMVSSE
ncbi:hypothetical protein Patl1_32603 [Pistacia atlantica]|uniref:Uncharacterized protein n=1 Tax=Pistacia atlantica TaxID=434234 RepID=A0ACC1AN73_9ROSI|nr:hypothetical protein Patl1_32603 [Pistacia atlantica]